MIARAAFITLGLTTLLLAGCAPNETHRPMLGSPPPDCPIENPPDQGGIKKGVWDRCARNSVEIGSVEPARASYKLAVVELDDQGRFRQERQRDNLLDLLDREIDEAHAGRSGGVSLLVFVHGWRHNADADDPNLEFARTVLYKTVLVEVQEPQYTPNKLPRSVVGVYVGWRGKSLTPPKWFGALTKYFTWLELPTFWDRKSTAERVALGSVRELFAELKAFRDENNNRFAADYATQKVRPEPNPNCETKAKTQATAAQICPGVRLFIVGHSFGGLLVYNALSESLIRTVTEARGRVVGEYADLVVLVNPAVEGARFEPLHQAVRQAARKWKYDPHQLPIFVSVTATNDWATGIAFPFGRWINTLFENESPSDPEQSERSRQIAVEEGEANRHALGHINRYKTHVLCLATDPDNCPPNPRPGSRAGELLARWGPALDAIPLNMTNPLAQANCVASIQERLAAAYLQPGGTHWDEGTDKTSRPVRYREFVTTTIDRSAGVPRLKLTNDGLTLRVHESLDDMMTEMKAPWAIHTPVWIVESNNSRIVNGHSDFTQLGFREFLVQLYHDRVVYGRDPDRLLDPAVQCRTP